MAVMDRVRYPDIEIREEEGGIEEMDEKIYVAVGKEVKESRLVLSWALGNFKGNKICLVHVHQPAQRIPIMGTSFSVSQLEEHQVRAYHEVCRENMHKVLNKYSHICEKAGVQAEILHIEMDSIEKGIIELISQHSIMKLVMGAAADKLYSKNMMEPKSKKAIYVRLQAPVSCQIWFICKGNLICTRKGILNGVNVGITSPSPPTSPSTLKLWFNKEGRNSQLRISTSTRDHRKAGFENQWTQTPLFPSPDGTGVVNHRSRLDVEGSSDESDGVSRRIPSVGSCISTSLSTEAVDDSSLVRFRRTDQLENCSAFVALPHSKGDFRHSSPPSVLEGSMNDMLYDRIEQAMRDAEDSRREAFEELIRRRKAEKEATEAVRRVKASEASYTEEIRQRKKHEEALARGQEELKKIKQNLDEVMEELRVALQKKSSLELQIENSDQSVQELEQKIVSAVGLLQTYRNDRDKLQVERDNALRIAEELRRKQTEEACSTHLFQFFSEFSFSEIEEATRNFDPSGKIGEGAYGRIYRGLLRHTHVAIKMLHAHNLQGPSEFQQEVNILSKLRHPNLVTLIGACPESWILIYEYLPNGSLEDRLSCKDNTPPLSWQTRVRIAAELCSVLIFLHSCTPHSIIHGDLKPSNILLDANYVSKLSNFGISRVLTQDELTSNTKTLFCRTDQRGSFAYMDPDFLATGELTAKSDVYSFGIIVLRLLTGRPALGLINEVKSALEKEYFNNLLDPTAGDWPFVQAKQLAHLAVTCCEMNCGTCPDFTSQVWRVLEPMGVSCGASSLQFNSEDHSQIPHYFICPIFQEIMQDPVVAADGYTYESEALKGWLDSGHDTSPMTNLKLAHRNLVPNHALRSAIQEWLQHQ